MVNNGRLTISFCLIVILLAQTAAAVDLDVVAHVEIVEGIVLVEDTAINFGEVALADGTVTVPTDGNVSDPDFISFDATNVSAGIFTVTATAGATYDITLVENVPVVGLALDIFRLSIDGGADEAGSDIFPGIVLAAQISTFDIGADLMVDQATASVGPGQTIGYRFTVDFN